MTNHYDKSYVCDGDCATFARRYIDEFRVARAYGDAVGCRVLFGAEVTMANYEGVHILIYGVDECFVEENPCLFDLSQEELYRIVKNVGGIVVQAHPFRGKKNLLDPRFLDGVEINCHPLYGKSDFSDMLTFAKENNLILTCGGDYHADTYRPKCGVYLPDHLKNNVEIGRYLLDVESLRLCIHEPNTENPQDYLYVRSS